MMSWQFLVLVIAFIILVLLLELPKRGVSDRRKMATVIFVIILVILLIASALSAFIYY